MNTVVKSQQRLLLESLYRAALEAANPMKVVPPHLPPLPLGRTVVVGVGKAAAAMAKAVEDNWEGELSGIVVVPDGARLPLSHVSVFESSHPVPDERSTDAATRLLQAVKGLTSNDLVIALISGGGSSLCALPAQGLELSQKQRVTRALLSRGATIRELNAVRTHLSAVKGGRLAAAAYPAQLVSLMISDIPGDCAELIASGPTLPNLTTSSDAIKVLTKYGLSTETEIVRHLSRATPDRIDADDPRLARNTHRIISTAWDGLLAAAQVAEAQGLPCHILSDSMEGEARDMARTHAGIALSVAQRNRPFEAPCVLLSGGEATVNVIGTGRGGRNTEFALAFALATDGRPDASRIHVLTAGTDGLDGNAMAAGAFVDFSTLPAARVRGCNPDAALRDNDSATLLETVAALIHTGPTLTNINDFRAIYIEAC